MRIRKKKILRLTAMALAMILISGSFPSAVYSTRAAEAPAEEALAAEAVVEGAPAEEALAAEAVAEEASAEGAQTEETPAEEISEEIEELQINTEEPLGEAPFGRIEVAKMYSDRPSPQTYGSGMIKLWASPTTIGYGTMWYAYYTITSKGEHLKVTNESPGGKLSWQPDHVGTYVFYATVRDSGDNNRTITSEHMEYVIEPSPVIQATQGGVRVMEHLKYGQKLSEAVLSEYRFSQPHWPGDDVPGTITFDDPDAVLSVGKHTVAWTFTPDSENYKPYKGTLSVTVEEADPDDDPGTNPGDDPGTNPGTDPGDDPGTNPGDDPGTNPGDDPGTDPGDDPVVLPGKTTRGDMFNLANNVKVTWQAVPGAKYYKVYRSGVKDPVIVTSGLIGWDNVKDPALENGKKYTYRIVASLTGKGDPSGDSPLSYSKVMYRLKTVAIRSVKNTEAGKVTVTYDTTTSGDSYVLQYSDNEAMNNAKTIVVQGADTTKKVIGGLKKGKTYYISIRVRKKVDGISYYTTFGVPKKIRITK